VVVYAEYFGGWQFFANHLSVMEKNREISAFHEIHLTPESEIEER
jgi:hypothetical protein